MKLLSLNFDTLIIRFYLMMAIVIVSFFIGLPWLSILSLPVFFSALIGMKFSFRLKRSSEKQTAVKAKHVRQPQSVA